MPSRCHALALPSPCHPLTVLVAAFAWAALGAAARADELDAAVAAHDAAADAKAAAGLFTPDGWALDLKLPPGGTVLLAGAAGWPAGHPAEFIWEVPGARGSDERMLYFVSGWRLPEDTPDVLELSDEQLKGLLLSAVAGSSGHDNVEFADVPQLTSLAGRTWLRAQATSGSEFAPRNSIVYLTYDAETYYVVVAEYNFVIDAGLFDAESSTDLDAEIAFQDVLSPPAGTSP